MSGTVGQPLSGTVRGTDPDGDFLPAFPFNDVELAAKARIEADFPTRRMIMGRTANLSRVAKPQMDMGRKRCEQHVRWLHGCRVGGYFSTQAATLPAALATGNLTVLTDRVVVSVVHDPVTGRATGVRTVHRTDKGGETFEAKLVFLNASAINTAVLLLNSKSDAFPRGLANGSDQVGRNLMDHVSSKNIVGKMPGFSGVYDQHDRPTGIYVPRYGNVTEGGTLKLGQNRLEKIIGYGTDGGMVNFDDILTKEEITLMTRGCTAGTSRCCRSARCCPIPTTA
mgnify:CR=1 FL=1